MNLSVVFFLILLDFIYCATPLTCRNIRNFVDGHNNIRERLTKGLIDGQPPAAKMYYMMWDEELAKKAAHWASFNKYGHNPNDNLESGRFSVGENIYMYSSSYPDKFDEKRAINAWFNEHRDYKFKPLPNKRSRKEKPTGHYTQMVWMDSIYIGCAVSKFKKNQLYNYYVVCNYGPAGNYIGQYPYINGTKGSGTLTCGTDDCSHLYGQYCQ